MSPLWAEEMSQWTPQEAQKTWRGNVYIVYRRSEAEMPARLEEIHHAKEEGILFKFLTNPQEFLAPTTAGSKAWSA